jgi:hypothetical protein
MERILAVSSAGGHWEQLRIISAAFEAASVHYATTLPKAGRGAGAEPVTVLTDCNRNRPLASLKCLAETFRLVRATRPTIVISTGAAPGLFAIIFGRFAGARTIWIDSVANCERLSVSGRMAGWVADLWLTQWRHLATGHGPRYLGSVL